MAIGIHSGNSWDAKTLMCDLHPCLKDKGSGRAELKWCCLERHWQKNSHLPLLLSALPSSFQTWPRAGAVSVWTLLSITHAGPKHSICWARGKCSSGCVRASVVLGHREGRLLPYFSCNHSLRFIVLGLPQLKSCPHKAACPEDVQAAQIFWEVWCVWLLVHAYHLTITRTGRKVWRFFVVVVLILSNEHCDMISWIIRVSYSVLQIVV